MQICMASVDWTDLRYLLAVHRARTLSAAARRIGCNQTTVGRRLDALEASLGARLFRRTPEGFFLTPEGERALAHAERMEEEVMSVEREISGHDEKPEGVVRLTTTDAVGSRFLAPRLGAFRARYPAIELQLNLDGRPLNLSRREADLALRMGRPQQSELLVRKVATVSIGLYASRSYLKRRGEPPRVEDLADHDIIAADEAEADLPEGRWYQRLTRGARIVLRCNSSAAQASAVADGVGIAALYCFVGETTRGLRRILPAEETERELWIAVHRDLQYAARVRAVIDFLDGAIRGAEALMKGATRPPTSHQTR